MDLRMGMMALGGVCAAALFIGVLRQKSEIVLNFLVRAILGVIAIYMINLLLKGVGIPVEAGINPYSVLTAASLGTGGLALIYGILFYHIL